MLFYFRKTDAYCYVFRILASTCSSSIDFCKISCYNLFNSEDTDKKPIYLTSAWLSLSKVIMRFPLLKKEKQKHLLSLEKRKKVNIYNDQTGPGLALSLSNTVSLSLSLYLCLSLAVERRTSGRWTFPSSLSVLGLISVEFYFLPLFWGWGRPARRTDHHRRVRVIL